MTRTRKNRAIDPSRSTARSKTTIYYLVPRRDHSFRIRAVREHSRIVTDGIPGAWIGPYHTRREAEIHLWPIDERMSPGFGRLDPPMTPDERREVYGDEPTTTFYHLAIETRSWSFDAYGRTATEAVAAMRQGWAEHVRQTGADVTLIESYLEDHAPRAVVAGRCYRDEQLL